MLKKFLSLSLLTAVMLSLFSCSNDDSALKLMTTVPGDAAFVSVVKIDEIAEKAPSDKNKELMDVVKSGAVDTGSAVFFVTASGSSYMVGNVNDDAKFRSFVEKDTKEKFRNNGEISVCRNIACKGDIFWVRIDSSLSLPVSDIEKFSTLPQKESFADNKYAGELCDSDEELAFIANIPSALSMAGGSFDKVIMGLSLMFDDAQWIAGTVDMEKSKVEYECKVLNSKLEEAQYLLPVGKIDGSVLKRLPAGSMAFAVAVPEELMQKILGIAQGAGAGKIVEEFKGINGTVAAVVSADGQTSFIAQTSSPAEAQRMAPSFGSVFNFGRSSDMVTVAEGSDIVVRSKGASGNLNIADINRLDGAILGFAVENVGGILPKTENNIRNIWLAIYPDDGSILLKGEVVMVSGKSFFDFI